MNESLDIKRIETSRILQKRDKGMVAIVGPCANHKERRIVNEGRQLAGIATEGLVTIHRIPPWKPRTPVYDKPKPWEGLESTNPTTALSRMLWERRRGVHVALEIGKREHALKYRGLAAFTWIGARNIDDTALDQTFDMVDMLTTPIGVKNELSGCVESAQRRTNHLDRIRRHRIDMPAATVMIFRGGHDLHTPKAWEDQYKRALSKTGGKMIVDVAHGSEMAHDPNGMFRKTVLGQMACLDHVINLASQGLVPAGIMIEASDYENPSEVLRTDPNMPFAHAIQGVKELHKIAMRGA